MIRRAGAHLPYNVRKMPYQSFVLPQLDYSSIIWHTCGATLTNRIEWVQNYALSMILQKPPRTSSAELRTKLNMKTLEHRPESTWSVRYTGVCWIRLLLTCHQSSAQILVLVTQTPLEEVRCIWNAQYWRLSLEFHGANLYNNLPESIETIETTRAFCAALNKLP